jgi:hypothetical protein
MTEIATFPHCDQRILHAPGECAYCDVHADWQELRRGWGIAFTGHAPTALLPRCHKPIDGYGRPTRCEQPRGHLDVCQPFPAWDRTPCPADADRPPRAANDHRRWGGNKPTTATGDPSWPAESAASHVMYGDRGGREPWPLRERIIGRLRRPLEDRRLRRRGFRRVGDHGGWRYP